MDKEISLIKSLFPDTNDNRIIFSCEKLVRTNNGLFNCVESCLIDEETCSKVESIKHLCQGSTIQLIRDEDMLNAYKKILNAGLIEQYITFLKDVLRIHSIHASVKNI